MSIYTNYHYNINQQGTKTYNNNNNYYNNQVYSYNNNKTTSPSYDTKYHNQNISKSTIALPYSYTTNYNKPQRQYTEDEFSSILHQSKIGLQNTYYSCYINTILQLLIHTPLFTKLFYKELQSFPSKTPLISKLYTILQQIISSSTETKSISPSQLTQYFQNKHKEYSHGTEQDSQEFCRVFLADLSEELNKVNKRSKYIELDFDNLTKDKAYKKYVDYCKSTEDSIILDIFYGHIINILRCQCGYQSYSFENIMDIPLLFTNHDNNNVNINDMLDLYFEDSNVEWGVKCTKCKSKRSHVKVTKFYKLPEVMILSLQRINQRRRQKNNSIVNFNDTIDMRKYVDVDSSWKKESTYQLYGVAYHKGDIDFGHYYARILVNEKWVEFNDSRVYVSGDIRKDREYVYLLFYRKVKNDKYSYFN